MSVFLVSIFVVVVRPRIVYGSPICYDREDYRIGGNESICPLYIARNRHLRAIIGVYRLVASTELKYETRIELLYIFLKRTVLEGSEYRTEVQNRKGAT